MSASHRHTGGVDGYGTAARVRRSTAYWSSLGLAWVTARGGWSVLRLLVERSPEEIWRASREDLVSWGVSPRAAATFCMLRHEFVPVMIEEQMEAADVRFLPVFSPEYPKELLHLPHPPAGLFVKAPREKWEAVLLSARVTVVGTRKATSYGARVTESFVEAFTQGGLAVVSGMALGIDSIAHRAALASDGLTVAVLGSGIDVPYPRSNLDLYRQGATNGAVVSEFPPGTAPTRWTFPRRNRLLAALGDGLLVTEASVTSGAMQTANWALELGKPVLAVPGSVIGDSHSGCNRLLYEGAHVALRPEEAVEDFLLASRMERGGRGPVDCSTPLELWSRAGERAQVSAGSRLRRSDALGAAETRILDALATGEYSADALAQETGLPLREVTAILGRLEIEGLVVRAGPGQYVRG
ncbi:MAG: DNA-processing protein DprA [Thermoleophilia bacterium]|nr:DNA-processing protein DprA [Thermoleophilia bacterium]